MTVLESAQLEAIRIENIKLRQQIADLRFNGTKPADDYKSLRDFLDDAATVCARHPDASAALAYFAMALERARGQAG